MVGYSNPEIQICKSAKDTRGCTLRVLGRALLLLGVRGVVGSPKLKFLVFKLKAI